MDQARLQALLDEDVPILAIIGLAGRFPGAPDAEAFWRNLERGVESVRFFTREELLAAGLSERVLDDPHFVRARAVIDDAESFDASFFGISPREAQVTDPQHRMFLECAWSALEDAAWDPERFPGEIGVFGGCSANDYLRHNLLSQPEGVAPEGGLESLVGSDKDYLCTRVAYKLGLTGPALSVQTACSTSLVAVQLACQSLMTYQCDMALAGGASLAVPVRGGHLHRRDDILSSDGHCRSFDARADGTVSGDGVGVVVLRRLKDAIESGDPIRALLRGAAVNNDGSRKVGFTAPSLDGQARVITAAHAMAGVTPESISYVEAHGTATALGDPVEVAALIQAFGGTAHGKGYCALGSVKSNIGHLNAAAGIAGLIKTVLSLEHERLPPSLHFEAPNPAIDFDASPFFVNAKARSWPRGDRPRRAGVSSFGIGGTNAHVIVEEAPFLPVPEDAPGLRILPLSARSEAALHARVQALAEHVEGHPGERLSDVVRTLAEGRRAFEYRAAAVAGSCAQLAADLRDRNGAGLVFGRAPRGGRPLVFVFPALGNQMVDMGRELYVAEPRFRERMDRCFDVIDRRRDIRLRSLLYPTPDTRARATEMLDDQYWAGPALFAVSWSLAGLWMDRGVAPDAVLGHSTGEYIAACVAGIFDLEAGLSLYLKRADLLARVPEGSGLHVPLTPEEVAPHLIDETYLALINGHRACVVTGTVAAIDTLEGRFTRAGVPVRRVRISVPHHTPLLASVGPELRAAAEAAGPRPPTIPFLSGLTGRRISDAEAMDPDYWVRHLVEPLQFAAAMIAAGQEETAALVEVGPLRFIRTLAAYNLPSCPVIPALPEPAAGVSPEQWAEYDELRVRASLWAVGARGSRSANGSLDTALGPAGGRRISLPTYPFQRRRYWIDPPSAAAASGLRPPAAAASVDVVEAEPRVRLGFDPRPDLPVPFVAPRNPTERALAGIVEELLGIGGIGVHDDFFELGGDSLITLRLIAQVKQRLGVELSPAAAFSGLNVERMAAFLPSHEGDGPKTSSPAAATPAVAKAPPSLVPIRREGSRPPLFFVHPAAGIVFPYFELARMLGPEQPFYGLQAHGLDGRTDPDHSVEDMAAHYLEGVREVQSKGPYFLGGYSFGALPAFEVARRLVDAGEQVAMLAIVDEPAPIDGHRPGVAQMVRTIFGDSPTALARHFIDYFYLQSKKKGAATSIVTGGFRKALERAAMASLLPEDSHAVLLDTPALGPMFQLMSIHLQQTFRYAPDPAFVRATLLFSDWGRRTSWYEREDPDPSLGWSRLALGGVEFRPITGDHLEVVRQPHVRVLAAQLTAAIDDAIRSIR